MKKEIIKKYADKKGFRIVALGRDADTPIAKIANAFHFLLSNLTNYSAVYG